MAKRPEKKKPKKKRPQPWLEATRARLRAHGDARHEQEMSDAFLTLVGMMRDEIGDDDADEEALEAMLHLGKIAWNLPLVHAVSTEPGSEGARARAEVTAWFASSPGLRRVLAPVIEARVQDFAHCGVLLAEVRAELVNGQAAIGLRFHGDEIPPSSVLDVDERGWPAISHSLLELSQPARDLLDVPYGDAEAQQVIDLATVAWNLPVLDRSGKLATEAVRRTMLDAAERARSLPSPWRETFAAMVTARETRFAYDPRLIMAAPAHTTEDGMLHVQAAAVHLEAADDRARP